MELKPNDTMLLDLPEEFSRRKRIIMGELKDRTLWFVRLRWWVPPSLAAGILVAWLIGVQFTIRPLLLVAAFILLYNVFLYFGGRRVEGESGLRTEYIQRFTYYQVGLDYAAMFLLIHYTGGAASPFIFFFIFHIIFAAILLPELSAYGFAAIAAAGMNLIAAAEYLGWIPHHALFYQGKAIDLASQPMHVTVELAFFSASVFITAFSTTSIMRMLRKRILDLAELSETVSDLNNKLNTLYAVIQAIGSIRNLEQVLHIVTMKLATVMDVEAISVKLLGEDAKFLNYAAAYGLPDEFIRNKTVEVAKSPLNRRIIEGESFVTGKVTKGEMFQFGEDLTAAGLQSVLFVPLKVEERIIGILGAYCKRPDKFGAREIDFFRLAAGLVAIALENARYYEAIEKMVRERSWFMMRVAHNLRAPLAATLSILDAVRGGYLGELNERQLSYLRRIDYPIRNMLSMINELMVLYSERSEKRQVTYKLVDLSVLVTRIQRTFQEEAVKKSLSFEVNIPEGIPEIRGDGEMIEQMIENLVSNAIKYTPNGGKVKMACAPGSNDTVCIEVSDNGIGIPKADMPRLFTEFFRAENAKAVDKIGTGLGLPIVKEIVSHHDGRITVESEEGLGTVFVVHLPVAQKERASQQPAQ